MLFDLYFHALHLYLHSWGDGSAANISLCLGRRQQQEADDTIGHAATLIAASGLCAAIVSWCFAPQIARLFGATGRKSESREAKEGS